MEQLRPIDSIEVFDSFNRLPNGSYVEWLESLNVPVRKLGFYISLHVYTLHINSIDEEWHFTLRGDDCVIATYVWNTRDRKIMCESAFVDDDETFDITREMFNERLKEFCEKYHLIAKYI